VIGPLIGAEQVCGAVEQLMADWLPSITAEITEAGGPQLPLPTTYDMPSAEALRAGNADLPAIVVSSPGLTGTPVRDGDGMYRATWRVVVTVFARGDGYRNTADIVRGYALAIRTAVVQHPGWGDLPSEVVWEGEEYAALDAAAARTVGGAFVTFAVTVDDVTNAVAGPLTPPVPPNSLITTSVTASSTDLTVQHSEELA
jgi:hypothetical protein